jgi:hypothetical protein
VSEKAKLDILAKLEDVSGPLVLRFMSAVPQQAQLPAAVREAASASTLRIAKAESQRQAKAGAPAAATPASPASTTGTGTAAPPAGSRPAKTQPTSGAK